MHMSVQNLKLSWVTEVVGKLTELELMLIKLCAAIWAIIG